MLNGAKEIEAGEERDLEGGRMRLLHGRSFFSGGREMKMERKSGKARDRGMTPGSLDSAWNLFLVLSAIRAVNTLPFCLRAQA